MQDFDGVIDQFDRILGKDQIAVFHLNDSKNGRGAGKDRHENIGFGQIGFDTLNAIAHHPDFAAIPKILETPYVAAPGEDKKKYPPYQYEIAMLREGKFDSELLDKICSGQ